MLSKIISDGSYNKMSVTPNSAIKQLSQRPKIYADFASKLQRLWEEFSPKERNKISLLFSSALATYLALYNALLCIYIYKCLYTHKCYFKPSNVNSNITIVHVLTFIKLIFFSSNLNRVLQNLSKSLIIIWIYLRIMQF